MSQYCRPLSLLSRGIYSLASFLRIAVLCGVLTVVVFLNKSAKGGETSHSHVNEERRGRSIVLTGSHGERTRVTPYGTSIVRVQHVRAREDFFPDDRYAMVEHHDWPGELSSSRDGSSIRLATAKAGGIVVGINLETARLSFFRNGETLPFLSENPGMLWFTDSLLVAFRSDPQEHFTGLGHGYYGREDRLDLRGTRQRRNYGTAHGQQSPLIVPFYLSSKGYGLFVNSTFPNTFSFGHDGQYTVSLAGDARMDYFVIDGPAFRDIIDRYTQLTGRPRFPPKAVFGLALSDKGNDHTSAHPSDEQWWKDKIAEHRNAGYPIDHIVNDNRWRAGGGQRCESYFAWDPVRYPDPAEYERWILAHSLYLTIDFNRCIAAKSEGWKPSFNIPKTGGIDFGESSPDFTRKEVREWFWNLFWRKSLNPSLGYPGDALWIDEFDELGKATPDQILGNGRTWFEMKNSWFLLIAQALVQEGWDTHFAAAKRPFVWVRGMTAGGQRFASLWSGDIKPTYEDMRAQIRSMQLAGMSGFPYWGHDAGGFHDWDNGTGPNDTLYRQWSMAFGSFSPFWKPHGMGQSRWPLDRSKQAQDDARRFTHLRYELMPYTYTAAHQAAESGLPIARAMVIDHQNDSLAWRYDLEYAWGDGFLVAPATSADDSTRVWLPKGSWYDFWTDTRYDGDTVRSFPTPVGALPLFVKSGSIVPMAPYANSTATIPRESLRLEIYTGGDASYVLYDDDGISEKYRAAHEYQTTSIVFREATCTVRIDSASGKFDGFPRERAYRITFHGIARRQCFTANDVRLPDFTSEGQAVAAGGGVVWEGHRLSVILPKQPTSHSIIIQAIPECH